MRMRWAAAAADDFQHITEYLFDETPQHAPRILRKLLSTISALKNFPNRGRLGKKPGTREMVVASLPYVVVYVLSGDVIYVARILHGAQKWPE